MPKNGLLVNTARKEVINEADLLRLMNDRPDLEYVTDIMPVHHAEFADHFRVVISLHRRKWAPKLPKRI